MNFWQGSFLGAISLSFDDGMQSQMEFAIPEMDSRGIKATFYLNPREVILNNNQLTWSESLERWIPHQSSGHEIGNHTVNHPCSLNINADWLKDKNILTWDIQKIEKDILEAQARINTVFPSQETNSFAYPCYESSVGRGPTRQSYTPIVARYFSAARAKGELRGDLANDPEFCDLHHLSSWPVERQPAALMIGLVEQAVRLGRWGIFTFHGIQEGHLPVGSTDFVELLNYLAFRKNDIWVAPVAKIAQYVTSRQVR